MTNKHHFKFDVDINVINHLGVGLYSSTPAALTELVANAWDADAEDVSITIDPANRSIVIEDDGHGMTPEDVATKFLHVGYSRRTKGVNPNFSNSGKRRVMGRKGIGKLSMFALADMVKVSTQTAGGELIGFEVDVPTLRKNLAANKQIELNEISPTVFSKGQGTRIELHQVLTGLKTTEGYLRVKLARRFSILGSEHNFKLKLNEKEVTKGDRDFYQHVQFLWAFDEATKTSISDLSKNIVEVAEDDAKPDEKTKCIKILPAEVSFGEHIFKVSGYVASVFKPKDLGSKEDSANIFSVFANGRVFAENVLTEATSAKYYQNYLVGEIHANFLDDDNVDRATASREAVKKDDPRYQALIGFVRSTLDSIGDQWDDWRTDLGHDSSEPGNKAVNDWLETLTDKRDSKAAKKLMASIKNAVIHPDEVKNESAKKILYRGAIIGFEKLKLKKQLDRLDTITDVLSPEFASIFSALNDVEEAAYSEIIKQRLEVIKKFKAIVKDPDSLEKVAHKYLFEHLWLLDPSWDRVTGRAEMEVTLTKHIKAIDPDSTGARLDLQYRASSGRHIVVELKRPKLTNIDFMTLLTQARKYKMAVEQYYRDTFPDDPIPPLDIYILIAKTPPSYSESDRDSLAAQNSRIITYDQLINDASNAYQAYLDVMTHTGSLETILAGL